MVIDAPELKGIAKSYLEDDDTRSVDIRDVVIEGDTGYVAGTKKTGLLSGTRFLLEISREGGQVISEETFSWGEEDELNERLAGLTGSRTEQTPDEGQSPGFLAGVTQLSLALLVGFMVLLFLFSMFDDISKYQMLLVLTWLAIPIVGFIDMKLVKNSTSWNPVALFWIVLMVIPVIDIIGGAGYLMRRRSVLSR